MAHSLIKIHLVSLTIYTMFRRTRSKISFTISKNHLDAFPSVVSIVKILRAQTMPHVLSQAFKTSLMGCVSRTWPPRSLRLRIQFLSHSFIKIHLYQTMGCRYQTTHCIDDYTKMTPTIRLRHFKTLGYTFK